MTLRLRTIRQCRNKFGQISRPWLFLELGTAVSDGLVADAEVLGELTVSVASRKEKKTLELITQPPYS